MHFGRASDRQEQAGAPCRIGDALESVDTCQQFGATDRGIGRPLGRQFRERKFLFNLEIYCDGRRERRRVAFVLPQAIQRRNA